LIRHGPVPLPLSSFPCRERPYYRLRSRVKRPDCYIFLIEYLNKRSPRVDVLVCLRIELDPLPWVDSLAAGYVSLMKSFHNSFRSCRLRTVDGLGKDKWGHEAPGGVLTHVYTVFLSEKVVYLGHEWFFPGKIECKGRPDNYVVAISFYRRQVARLDITGHSHNA